jgi:hypothetical protein
LTDRAYPLVAEIVCIECDRQWIDASERWRILVSDDDPPEAVAYCQSCAEREFGKRSSAPAG